MGIKRGSKIDPSFSMSSMTDIVFLLLIFFMISTTLLGPNTNAVKLLLPRSSSQTSTKAMVSVSIKQINLEQFDYYVGTQAVPFSDIERQLQQALKNEEEPVIALYADRSVPIEQAVSIMNIASRNKYRVILATSPE